MRDFIDRLRVRRIQCNSSADLDDLAAAASLDRRVLHGPSGLDSIDEALRVVCDRLDALVIVSDAVLADRAGELFETDRREVSRCMTVSAVVSQGAPESTTRGEDAGEETATLRTENRQLFDQIVDIIRQVDEASIQRHSDDVATVDSHCQTQRTDRLPSSEYSEELTDTDRLSDSTDANSTRESSYTTCDGSSPSSASPNVRRQLVGLFEEISTDCASDANKAQLCGTSNLTTENHEPAISESSKYSKARVKLSENARVVSSEEQWCRSALELLRKEQSLLQLQERTNMVLHGELVQLSDDNRKLQNIIAQLGISLDRKNNEVASLRNAVDHIGRLLDEQVEEFRCVFRAVTRENDQELDRLATENSKLRSALASRDNGDGFVAEGSTEKRLSGSSTSAHEQTYSTFIREHSVCVIPDLLHTEDGLNSGKLNRETENDVGLPPRFNDGLCPNDTELDRFIPAQRCSLALDRVRSDAHLLVPARDAGDSWSETEDLKKTAFEQGPYLATYCEEREQFLPVTDWNDSGVIMHTDSVVGDERDTDGLELTEHPPLDHLFCRGRPLNPCSTQARSFQDTSCISRTGSYLEAHREVMENEEKPIKKKPLFGLNGSVNKVSTSRINSAPENNSFTDIDQQESHLPDVELFWHTQPNTLYRSTSDSCLLSQLYTSGSHDRCLLRSFDFDYSPGIYEFRRRPRSTGYFRRYQKHGIDIRNVATQTNWQETNNVGSNADVQPPEDGIFEQACTVFDNDITKLYRSLKSELQRFQEIVIRDDFAIIHEYRVEDFSSSDLQFILAHFKHHIEQKLIRNEENRLLVDEIGQLLSELLELRRKLGYDHFPVITEESSFDVNSKVNQEEVEKHDVPLLESTSVQTTECTCDHQDFNHQLAEYDTEIARYSGFNDVEIPAPASVSTEEKQLQRGQTLDTELPQSIYVFDQRSGDFENTFVPKSCIREMGSRWRTPQAAFSHTCPMPFLRTDDEHLFLTDVVRQMRHQNARLACCLSAVDSFFHHLHYSRTLTRLDDGQLQTTLIGQPGSSTAASSMHRKQQGDCSQRVRPTSSPIKSSPCMTLSVVCLQRPLVIDLSTSGALSAIVKDFSAEDKDKNVRDA